MKVRIHFEGFVDVEIPEDTTAETFDDAVGVAWAAVPTPEDTSIIETEPESLEV